MILNRDNVISVLGGKFGGFVERADCDTERIGNVIEFAINFIQRQIESLDVVVRFPVNHPDFYISMTCTGLHLYDDLIPLFEKAVRSSDKFRISKVEPDELMLEFVVLI